MSEKVGSDPPNNSEPKASRKSGDPVWTILPSYYMYHSTFSGESDPPVYTEDSGDNHTQGGSASDSASRVTSSHEDLTVTPTSVSNSTAGDQSRASIHRRSSVGSSGDGSFIVADESSSSWRETILDNFSLLRNLTHTDNKMASALKMSIHFTKDVGEPGVKPEIIDPSLYEYKQGDLLNGFIFIKNEGTEYVPFDMFYVHFEGNFIVADSDNVVSRRIVKVKKFLEMYDLAASWNPAHVFRLPSEQPVKDYDEVIDPLDGSHLLIGMKKRLVPGGTYKRFFTFRIPVRLLDSECNDHNLSGHTELPPTLGLCRQEKELGLAADQRITDFSFPDTSLSHGLWARFIGKASKYGATDSDSKNYKLINTKGDEFVILKEVGAFTRIVQESKILSDAEREATHAVSRVIYNSFVDQIKNTIAVGEELKKAMKDLESGGKLDDDQRLAAIEAAQRDNQREATKMRQLYHPTSSARDIKAKFETSKTYEVAMTHKKKTVFGKGKDVGSLILSTPRVDYLLSYISPKRFRTRGPIDPSSWKVEIPVELTYGAGHMKTEPDTRPPEITSVFGELIVFTLKSNNRPIPIELNHEFLFKNISKTADGLQSLDTFTHIVKIPMQQYAAQIHNLCKSVGYENLQVSKGMLEDVAALSKSDEKYNRLVLCDISTIDGSGDVQPCKKGINIPWKPKGHGQYSKCFSLKVDVTQVRKMSGVSSAKSSSYKAYDEFTLVPSFQTCLMSRLYYFRFVLGFTGGQCLEFKLPVTIAKAATEIEV